MISLLLSLIFTWLMVSVLWFTRYIVLPYIAIRIEQARWQKMHPGMPSWRRVS